MGKERVQISIRGLEKFQNLTKSFIWSQESLLLNRNTIYILNNSRFKNFSITQSLATNSFIKLDRFYINKHIVGVGLCENRQRFTTKYIYI